MKSKKHYGSASAFTGGDDTVMINDDVDVGTDDVDEKR